jgi:hypothetical protein
MRRKRGKSLCGTNRSISCPRVAQRAAHAPGPIGVREIRIMCSIRVPRRFPGGASFQKGDHFMHPCLCSCLFRFGMRAWANTGASASASVGRRCMGRSISLPSSGRLARTPRDAKTDDPTLAWSRWRRSFHLLPNLWVENQVYTTGVKPRFRSHIPVTIYK